MTVLVNGDEVPVTEGATVADLISNLDLKPERLAVEVNRKILRRSDWAATCLTTGDRVEIVHFVGGGALVFPAPETGFADDCYTISDGSWVRTA